MYTNINKWSKYIKQRAEESDKMTEKIKQRAKEIKIKLSGIISTNEEKHQSLEFCISEFPFLEVSSYKEASKPYINNYK